MKKSIRINNKTLPILSILCVISVLLLVGFTVAKLSIDTINSRTDNRVATFDVVVDGVPSSTVDCKIYATSKVNDIEEVTENVLYNGNSFIDGAYRTYSLVVHNNSEVKTSVELNINKTFNDDRIFYAILPNCATEQDIYKKIYEKTGGSSLSLTQIRAMCDEFNSTIFNVDNDDYLRLTLVVWAEHDAVFVDEDNNGVADEANKKISELTNGIPTETLNINYTIVQRD